MRQLFSVIFGLAVLVCAVNALLGGMVNPNGFVNFVSGAACVIIINYFIDIMG